MKIEVKWLCMLIGFFSIISCQKETINQNNVRIDLSYKGSGTNTSNRLKYGSMRDIDGNTYKTIQIGSQVWMAENLRVTKYRNGNTIPNITGASDWINATSGAWCIWNNDNTLNTVYGKFYNWYAVNDIRGLAPKGWHIPSESEVNTLLNYLGGASIAGGKMKESGTSYWVTTNADVTNSSGFSARGSGDRVNDGNFYENLYQTVFWTSTLLSDNTPSIYLLRHGTLDVLTGGGSGKYFGFSVRCIKD